MKTENKAMLAAGIAYSIFGLSYLFSKMALDLVEPAVLLCVRFSVTVLLLNAARTSTPAPSGCTPCSLSAAAPSTAPSC